MFAIEGDSSSHEEDRLSGAEEVCADEESLSSDEGDISSHEEDGDPGAE